MSWTPLPRRTKWYKNTELRYGMIINNPNFNEKNIQDFLKELRTHGNLIIDTQAAKKKTIYLIPPVVVGRAVI